MTNLEILNTAESFTITPTEATGERLKKDEIFLMRNSWNVKNLAVALYNAKKEEIQDIKIYRRKDTNYAYLKDFTYWEYYIELTFLNTEKRFVQIDYDFSFYFTNREFKETSELFIGIDKREKRYNFFFFDTEDEAIQCFIASLNYDDNTIEEKYIVREGLKRIF